LAQTLSRTAPAFVDTFILGLLHTLTALSTGLSCLGSDGTSCLCFYRVTVPRISPL